MPGRKPDLTRDDVISRARYGKVTPVCTENLNPPIMVMKSAKDRV